MAVPTTEFLAFTDASVIATDVNTVAKRKGTPGLTGEETVSTGAGNELDFSTVDISGGAADSIVRHCIWKMTANGSNTQADTWLIWLSSNGWDQAGTVAKFQEISGADNGAPSNTETYITNAVVGSYTWTTMLEVEGSAHTLYQNDETATMDITTIDTTDDTVFWANYVAVAASETTGTYKGTDASYEFQYSFKYSYS